MTPAVTEQLEFAVAIAAPRRVSVAALAAELRVLRKGRGARVGQSVKRIGPTLRAICAITRHDDPAEMLHTVAEWLRDGAVALPEDLHLCVLAAFGLHAQAQQPLYSDRVRWVAARLDRDPRTARRRIDKAIGCLAELARRPRKLIDLREFVGQPVELRVAIAGAAKHHLAVRRGYLVAVARTLDDGDRWLAILDELLDYAPATIAIPTARIRGVTVLNRTGWHRAVDPPVPTPRGWDGVF